MSDFGFFSSDEISRMSSGVCPPSPTDYKLPTHFPDLRGAKVISLDLETHDPNLSEKGIGCRRGDGYIVGVAVATEDWAGEYYPIAHRNGPNLDKRGVLQWLRDNLAFFKGTITGANVNLYDGDWLQSQDIIAPFAKWWDVQWAEALLDETALNYKLQTLGKKYLGIGKTTDELKRLYGPDYIKRFREVHPGHARPYGLGDVQLPIQIMEPQRQELAAAGLTELFDVESRLTPFLLYLRRQGVRVDLNRIHGFHDLLTGKRTEALRLASEACGVHLTVDNFGKNAVLAHVFNKLKIDYPVTEKGTPSIKNKWLEKIDHPVGKFLAAANKYDKAHETFVTGYIDDYAIGDRVYGEFHPLRKADDDAGDDAGTETGRFSASHPNLQNIPARDEELGPLLRSMFVPEPGGEWWSLDYSQIEYRYLVHFAVVNKCKGAKDAQEMYVKNPDVDFHQAVAELTGLKRKDAKNLNFGLVYGMGEQKLAESLGLLEKKMVDGKWKMVPSQAALDIMKTYHGKAPFIKALYQLCGDRAFESGETRTILNRRRKFELYEPCKYQKGVRSVPYPWDKALETYGFDIRRSMTHKALNSTLQGSAADQMKMAMVLAYEAGVFTSTKDFTCSITVHDELDGTIFPTPRGLEAYNETKHILMNAIDLEVPVLVGEGRGANWAEAK